MLSGKFVVTFQENTLFILDSMNGVVVGVAVFKDNIKSISTSGGFLYILTDIGVIVRAVVHYSYVTAESEPWKPPKSTPTSVNNSPLGSSECLVKGMEKLRGTMNEGVCDSHERQQENAYLGVEKSHNQASPLGDVIAEVPEGVPTVHIILCSVEDSVGEQVIHQDLEGITRLTSAESSTSEPYNEDLKTGSAGESKVAITDHESRMEVDTEARMEADTIGKGVDTTLGKSQLSLPQQNLHAREETKEVEILDELGGAVTRFDDTNEQSRRVRMSQAAGEDIVADSKSHRKRRKKVKGKKLSSAASKWQIGCKGFMFSVFKCRVRLSIFWPLYVDQLHIAS